MMSSQILIPSSLRVQVPQKPAQSGTIWLSTIYIPSTLQLTRVTNLSRPYVASTQKILILLLPRASMDISEDLIRDLQKPGPNSRMYGLKVLILRLVLLKVSLLTSGFLVGPTFCWWAQVCLQLSGWWGSNQPTEQQDSVFQEASASELRTS